MRARGDLRGGTAKRWEAVVVGAGAAGLAAAEQLSRSGLTVAILEARPRWGGRVWTRRLRGWPLPIELGAEFVHGRNEALFEIARSAGLLVDRLPDTHLELVGSRLRPRRNFWEQFESVTRRMRSSGRDRSVAEFLHARSSLSPTQRRLTASLVEGFNAAPLERASEHALSTAGEPAASPEDREQFRILSGYAGVTDWLRKGLDPKRCRLRLSTAVTRIRWRRGSVTLETAAGETFRARRAVVTVPAGVLKARPPTPGAIVFDPELRGKRKALNGIEMGDVVKVILRFREPFWRETAGEDGEEIAFLHRRGAPFPTWWTASPAQVPMLTGWAGGPAAHALLRERSLKILDRALETISKLFGINPSRVRRLLVGGHAHDWTRDPFARGAYSYQAVGGASAPAALARPVEGTLFFAGEATETDESGTVPGAIRSGRRAAHLLLKGLVSSRGRGLEPA